MSELNELKRGRGRPKGASRLNGGDSQTLLRMAELIIATPMQPTTAMRRLNVHGEAETRRLQRKWKKNGPQYLQAAERRREDAKPSLQEIVDGISSGVQAVASHLSPTMERLHSHMNSSSMRNLMEGIHALSESPQFRRLQEVAAGIEARRRELEASPLAQRVRDMQAAHARYEQELANNPAIKRLQERMADPKFQEQMQRAADQFSRVGMVWPADPVKRVRR